MYYVSVYARIHACMYSHIILCLYIVRVGVFLGSCDYNVQACKANERRGEREGH